MNRIIPLFILPVLLSGCFGGKQLPTRHYLLEYPEGGVALAVSAAELPLFHAPVFVENVQIHPAFSTHQIAIREDSNEVSFFSFNEWAVRPSVSLTIMTRRFLAEHGYFNRLVTSPQEASKGYGLAVQVERIEVVRDRNKFVAMLSMSLTLTENLTGDVVLSKATVRSEPLAERNLNLFAQTISRLYIEELHRFFSQQHPVSSDE